MKRMGCEQLEESASELALGILPGDERAAALAHLDECPGCREYVSSVASLTDQLLLLAPRAEPSPGFEQRVLASLRPTEPVSLDRRRRTRQRVAVAALALAACLTIAAFVFRGGSSPPALAAAEMRADGGTVVGQVYVQRDPATLFLSLPGWTDRVKAYGQPGASYAVRIERTDGPTRVVPVTVNADGSWAGTLDMNPGAITNVAMVDSHGTVWCQAQFRAT